MSVAKAVFLVNENDELKRIPYNLYKRLWDGNGSAKEYANQVIRCIAIYVLGCKPWVQYRYLIFDGNGSIDRNYKWQTIKSAMDTRKGAIRWEPTSELKTRVNKIVSAMSKYT